MKKNDQPKAQRRAAKSRMDVRAEGRPGPIATLRAQMILLGCSPEKIRRAVARLQSGDATKKNAA